MTDADYDHTIERLDAALATLGSEDATVTADALGLRSRVCWLAGRWDEALSSATEAVEALEGLPESPQLARALARLSQIEMLKQRRESLATAEKALADAARVGDRSAEVNARINLVTQRSSDGIPPDAREVAEIVDAAAAAGEHEEAYRALVNFVWASTGFVSVVEAERVVERARERLADVPPPASIGPYLQVSLVLG